MNFFDSLFEKIPVLRDIDPKKRKLAAIFLVFVVISILGILIDAIAKAGGAIALTAVAIGFLLMAVIIIADYMMNQKKPAPPPQKQEQYTFFDDSPDGGYQDDSYEYYQAEDGVPDSEYDRYGDYNNDTPDFDDRIDGNDGNYDDYPEPIYGDESYGDSGDDFSDLPLTDSPQPEPVREETSRKQRFGGVFRRGGQRTEAHDVSAQPPVESSPEIPLRTSFDFQQSHPVEPDSIGEPVMNFAASPALRDEVTMAADAVAPGVVPPPPSSRGDVIGGPVMSIPFRGESAAPAPVEESHAAASYAPPSPPVSVQTVPVAQPRSLYQDRRDSRGKEIDEFFEEMTDEELRYSDCVEVWAADAKPAAIRLLKLVEALPDKKTADALGREAEYINAMLDRIYYFTMLDSIRDNLELKEYNFSAVVKDCLRRFSPFFMEKRIGLLWKGLDINIVTDKRWLIFALTQVVFNAVEFTGLGGKIAISAKKEGSLIHLMVDDNGCGIPEAELPKIFLAGYMGDNVPNESGRRTGMGLFITRSVVEKLGGSVTVESTVGKGTRITMILPEKP